MKNVIKDNKFEGNGTAIKIIENDHSSSIKTQITNPKKQSKATMAVIIKWGFLIIGAIASSIAIYIFFNAD